MVSGLITGAQILKKYSRYVKKKGNKHYIRNSTGRWIQLSTTKLYYHRGNGRFADWSVHRDGTHHAGTVIKNRRYLNKGDMKRKQKVGKKRMWI